MMEHVTVIDDRTNVIDRISGGFRIIAYCVIDAVWQLNLTQISNIYSHTLLFTKLIYALLIH